jgi:hypothetical protein
VNQRKRTSTFQASRVGFAAAAIFIAASLSSPATTAAGAGHHHRHRHHHHAKRLRRAAHRGPMTFQGQCHFTGKVTFTPAMTNDPQVIQQHVNAPGACTGTLTDRRGRTHDLQDGRAAYIASELAPNSSCSNGTAEGNGKLVFRYGSLRFVESETRAGVVVSATATGRKGGTASGVAEPTPDQNPADALRQCAGSGIHSARIAIDLATTPTFSG